MDKISIKVFNFVKIVLNMHVKKQTQNIIKKKNKCYILIKKVINTFLSFVHWKYNKRDWLIVWFIDIVFLLKGIGW